VKLGIEENLFTNSGVITIGLGGISGGGGLLSSGLFSLIQLSIKLLK